jgi:hypothetical protein
VRIKDPEHRNMSHLAQTRDLLVKQRSADPGKVASYFGLVPRVKNSNETGRTGASPSKATSWRARHWCNVHW